MIHSNIIPTYIEINKKQNMNSSIDAWFPIGSTIVSETNQTTEILKYRI